jgi:elongation factor Ts
MSKEIDIKLIKEFRDATGVSVMQCKRALEETDGDFEKALAVLKKNSSDIAIKKAGREVTDGAVMVKSKGNKIVSLILQCETDFVSKSEDFTSLLNNLTEKVLVEGVENTKTGSENLINPVIQKTGENIKVGEVFLLEGNVLGGYVHNNKSAVLVSLEGGSEELAKNIAMHITAMRPEYLSADEIKEETRKTITEIFQKEVAEIKKPEEIKKKILESKIESYFQEKTLSGQAFIKDPKLSIKQLLEKSKASIKEIKRCSI